MEVKLAEDLSLFEQVFSLHQQIPEFDVDSAMREQMIHRLHQVKHPITLVAHHENHPVGYLVGYERYSSYYIWLAGVLPASRRQGVLAQLLARMEQWATEHKFRALTIKTRNRFKSMLLFLIAKDFQLIDIDKRESTDQHRLILEKKLIVSEGAPTD